MPKRRPRRRGPGPHPAAGLVAAALALLATPALADPPARSAAASATEPGDVSAALALHDEARARYERGEYREAIAKLEAALKVDPRGKELVYNLALIHERLAELDVAERYYRLYLTMETDPKVRGHVEGVLRRVQGARREVARPGTAASASSTSPASSTAAAAPERPRADRWVLALSGVAAAGAIAGTAFAVGAFVHAGESTGHDAEVARADAVVAHASFLLAGVAAGLAIGIHVSRSGGAAAAPAASLGVAASPAGGSFVLRF